jgi:hypothetical protein
VLRAFRALETILTVNSGFYPYAAAPIRKQRLLSVRSGFDPYDPAMDRKERRFSGSERSDS